MKHEGFSIRIASRESGVTPFVIRAWERRYCAVKPIRTSSNQRRYTQENIRRLKLLKRSVDLGYRIGDIADMSDDALNELIEGQTFKKPVSSEGHSAGQTFETNDQPQSNVSYSGAVLDSTSWVQRSINLIQDMNESGLEVLLSRASISMSMPEYLDNVILPLTKAVGDKWHTGELRISQEHMATWVIKSIVSGLLRSHRARSDAPMMVVTTPAGQRHEIGAMAVALSGAHSGWNVTYLGPDLPAEEIAAMALKTDARLVALSLVYPYDDPHIPEELSRLKHLLPINVAVVTGGSAARAYKRVIESLEFRILRTLADFRSYLLQIQNNSD
jgi:MerR family transcriptional regulator, light-induced transcriptional regulator